MQMLAILYGIASAELYTLIDALFNVLSGLKPGPQTEVQTSAAAG